MCRTAHEAADRVRKRNVYWDLVAGRSSARSRHALRSGVEIQASPASQTNVKTAPADQPR